MRGEHIATPAFVLTDTGRGALLRWLDEDRSLLLELRGRLRLAAAAGGASISAR